MTNLQSPFALKSTDGTGTLDLTWTRLDVDLVGLPDVVAQTGLEAEAVALAGDVPRWGRLDGAAARVIVQSARRTDRSDNAYDVHLRIEGAPRAAARPAARHERADARRVRRHAEPSRFRRRGQRRAAASNSGGRGAAGSISARYGSRMARRMSGVPAVLHSTARTGPRGGSTPRFGGLEPVLRRFGVDPGLVAATGLLGSLLGGRNSGRADDGGGLRLPVTLAGGRVAIGPVRTGIPLPPLY